MVRNSDGLMKRILILAAICLSMFAPASADAMEHEGLNDADFNFVVKNTSSWFVIQICGNYVSDQGGMAYARRTGADTHLLVAMDTALRSIAKLPYDPRNMDSRVNKVFTATVNDLAKVNDVCGEQARDALRDGFIRRKPF
jgi:hypothetical protein